MMPGQAYRGKLDETHIKRMLGIAARPPVENAKRITSADGGMGVMGILRHLNSNTDTVSGPANSLYPF